MGGEAPPPPSRFAGFVGGYPLIILYYAFFGWFNGKLSKLRVILSIGETETKSIVNPIKKWDRAPVGAFDRKYSLTF